MLDISTVGIVSVPKKVSVGNILQRAFQRHIIWYGIGTVLVVEQSGLESSPRGVWYTPSYTYNRRSGFFGGGVFWGFKESWSPGGKREAHPSWTGRQRLTEHVCKIPESISTQRRGTFPVLCGQHICKVPVRSWRSCLVIISFQYRIHSGVKCQTWCWPYAVRSWTLSRNVLLTCFAVMEITYSFRNKMKNIVPFYGNPLLVLTFLKARGWLGHILAGSARPRASPKK